MFVPGQKTGRVVTLPNVSSYSYVNLVQLLATSTVEEL